MDHKVEGNLALADEESPALRLVERPQVDDSAVKKAEIILLRDKITLADVSRAIESIREQIRSIEISPQVREKIEWVRVKLEKLGIPGLILWNIIDFSRWAVPTYYVSGGTNHERLSAAGVVGGIAIVTNVSFWLALRMIYKKIKNGTVPEQHESLNLSGGANGPLVDSDESGAPEFPNIPEWGILPNKDS